MRSRFILRSKILAVAVVGLPIHLYAAEYNFCVICDNYTGNVYITSTALDLGKEWYRVKTGMLVAQARGSQSCSVGDYSAAQCGGLPVEQLEYRSINGDQIDALFSGNPAVIGQTMVEVIVNIPVEIIEGIGSFLGF